MVPWCQLTRGLVKIINFAWHEHDQHPGQRAPAKPRLGPRSIAWSTTEDRILERIAQDASDVIGRRISSSAILRAVIGWLGDKGTGFSREELVPRIEKELSLLHWGSRKAS